MDELRDAELAVAELFCGLIEDTLVILGNYFVKSGKYKDNDTCRQMVETIGRLLKGGEDDVLEVMQSCAEMHRKNIEITREALEENADDSEKTE